MKEGAPVTFRVYRHSGGQVRIANELMPDHQSMADGDKLVIIRPAFVGVCSADIRELRGERPGRSDFGHEVVGTVLESTHCDYRAGQSVVLNPFAKVRRETAFAEVMYVTGPHELLKSALLEVPAIRMEFSAVEPLACVIHAARQSRLNISGSRLVLGAGFFGYLLYCYLESKGIPVALANPTPERLEHLRQSIAENGGGELRAIPEISEHRETFSTVFLTRARLSREDVTSAVDLVQDCGEIVLFGAVNPVDAEFYTIRNQQQRSSGMQGAKTYFLQGTLDAAPKDLRESVEMLGQPRFARKVAAIFAPPLTFEEGAAHLSHRAISPRSYEKYVVAPNPNS